MFLLNNFVMISNSSPVALGPPLVNLEDAGAEVGLPFCDFITDKGFLFCTELADLLATDGLEVTVDFLDKEFLMETFCTEFLIGTFCLDGFLFSGIDCLALAPFSVEDEFLTSSSAFVEVDLPS